MFSFKKGLFLFLKGMLMGIADLIPGVSGGTIAFITGIYDQLMDSLQNFNPFTFKTSSFKSSASFLAILAAGILSSIAGLSGFFSKWLHEPFESSLLYSCFFGLILSSLYFISKEISWKKLSHWLLLITAITLTISFSKYSTAPSYEFQADLESGSFTDKESILNYASPEKLNLTKMQLDKLRQDGIIKPSDSIFNLKKQTWTTAKEIPLIENYGYLQPKFILLGFLASGAMLLPGISGSFLLLVLGAYSTVLFSLSTFFSHALAWSFHSSSFYLLLNLIIGIVLGLIFLSQLIKALLNSFREKTLSALIGMMCGGLYLLWPFWSTAKQISYAHQSYFLELVRLSPQLPELNINNLIVTVFASLGLLVSFFIQRKSSN
jgi:putative membrane protein